MSDRNFTQRFDVVMTSLSSEKKIRNRSFMGLLVQINSKLNSKRYDYLY